MNQQTLQSASRNFGVVAALLLCATQLLAAEVSETSHFSFHSDPWVNLHHFLYHEARNTVLREKMLGGRVRTYPADRDVGLTDGDRLIFENVLSVYARYGEGDLLFDRTLFDIGATVVYGPDSFPRDPGAEPAYAALERMMPLYLKYWWPRHDVTNRTRIRELVRYLEQYEKGMADFVATSYGVAWPETIRVDVSVYSGRHGAYATNRPNHIVLASPENWFPGLLALDLLFHESGHTRPFQDQVHERSRKAAAAAGVDEGDVWHAFLFYIPSQAARKVLPESHTPYAYQEDGPLARGRMSRSEFHIRQALEQTRDLDEVFRLIHESRAADHSDESSRQ
ncbi:hypothetical protein [Elongatibacter sediminis]|uniref:DUF4932 domain-containing protein n=1 Tax=Elongatibacter sediminis TaxID=3119006 RepID=A0AAW9RAK8_9GAMM